MIVVAMPVQSTYEIDPELRELETNRALTRIDLRKVAASTARTISIRCISITPASRS